MTESTVSFPLPQQTRRADSSWPFVIIGSVAGTVLLVLGVIVTMAKVEPNVLQTATSYLVTTARLTSFAPGMDHYWITINLRQLGDPYCFAVLIGFLAIACVLLRDWHAAAVAIAAPILTEIITQAILKDEVTRGFLSHYEFPSGHTAGATSIAVVALIIVARRFGHRFAVRALPLLACLPVAVGIASVLVGAHDLIDVLGGFAVGVCVPCLFAAVFLGDARSAVTR